VISLHAILLAHAGHEGLELMRHWTWDPWVIAGLLLLAIAYTRGVTVMWQRAGVGHGIRRWEVASFAAGMATLVIALLSPLDWASDTFFSAHMTQHELLMIVAAPLIVLGRTLIAFFWALPEGQRQRVGEVLRRPWVSRPWRTASGPIVVLIIHGLVVWLWHIPALFEAALASEFVHGIQHLTFFITAALFFWALVYGRYGKAGYGLAVLFVFATATHTTVLGALLTCAKAVWYPGHASRSIAVAVDPMADQQLAGLIMWIPAAVIFLVIALVLFAAWVGESERRVARRGNAMVFLVVALLAAQACSSARARDEAERITHGSVERGLTAMRQYGCGACHEVPGLRGGNGRVGPPLTHMASRTFIAGKLQNTPDNMMTWIMHPQMIVPGNAMPDMGIDAAHARDIAAFIYTLR
jgi:putative membrane protein